MEPMDSDYRCEECGVLVTKNTGQNTVYRRGGKKVCRKHYYEKTDNFPPIGITFYKKNSVWDPPV